MRHTNVRVVPGFDFAYTDPLKDVDVSGGMHHNGGVELEITKVRRVGGMGRRAREEGGRGEGGRGGGWGG